MTIEEDLEAFHQRENMQNILVVISKQCKFIFGDMIINPLSFR